MSLRAVTLIATDTGEPARCEACKWWDTADRQDRLDTIGDRDDPAEDDPDEVAREGQCLYALGPRRRPGYIAHAEDGSDYRARFYTRNDFGCIAWERKPPGQPS